MASNTVCRGGYANIGGRCLEATGKATKKAKKAIVSRNKGSTPTNAMPSNEAKREVRGRRRIKGHNPRGGYKGNEMEHKGGGAGNIRGGSDNSWHTKHGDRMMTNEIPRDKKLGVVSGGTGHRNGTPNNANSHVVTDPHRGNTPRPRNSKGRQKNDRGYVRTMKRSIKNNGDYERNVKPSNGGTGGGQGRYHGYGRDSMGSKKGKGFLKKRRASKGHNKGNYLNHRRDAF
jgi:hypothetical protein